MTYERTEEIKDKQRKTMLEKTKDYKWDEITKKRKETILKNNIKVGRRKGEIKEKTGWFKKCKCCDNTMWVIPSNHIKRIYCSKGCMWSDDEYRQSLKQKDTSYMRTEEYAKCKGNPNPSEFRRYRNLVTHLTEETYVKNCSELNPRNLPRTLAGVNGGYHLDHIISVKQGFIDNIPAEQISAKENLQMLPWIDNIKKGSK